MNQKKAKQIRKSIPNWRDKEYVEGPRRHRVLFTGRVLPDGKAESIPYTIPGTSRLSDTCGHALYREAKGMV